MKILVAICGFWLALAATGRGQGFVDRADETLTLSGWHDNVRVHLSGLLDAEGYYFEHPAPGLIDTTNRFLFNPRLTLLLDGQIGGQVYFFVQARLDQGFDPSDGGPRIGLNEYAVRLTPWQDGRLSVQVGKAATVFGTWTGRHLSWENPFINTPLPYENVSAVSDKEAPASARDFGRVEADEKYEYLPVIWGPSYTTGLTVSGRYGHLDYAAEVKNAALSSRPESWDLTEIGFDHPAFNARIGFRPDLAWNFGFSASDGAYLRPEAGSDLPKGRGIGDYREVVFGQDASYAVGRWQIWAEAFESRFEVPRVGDLDAFSYYLEMKYKFTPQFFGALRWNQQFFAHVDGTTNSRDTSRIDAAITYRFTPHVQWKLQYSFQHGEASPGDGSTVSTQVTVRF